VLFERWQTTMRIPIVAVAVNVIATITLNSTVWAQSSALQARCAEQAQIAFLELEREYENVLERLNVPFKITSHNYEASYSSKVDLCLFLVHRDTSVMRNSSHMSYLLDAKNRDMYALYVDTDGRMESCTLMRNVRETRTCKDRGEFDAFVVEYMEK
jgi:hypothetical protein